MTLAAAKHEMGLAHKHEQDIFPTKVFFVHVYLAHCARHGSRESSQTSKVWLTCNFPTKQARCSCKQGLVSPFIGSAGDRQETTEARKSGSDSAAGRPQCDSYGCQVRALEGGEHYRVVEGCSARARGFFVGRKWSGCM